jgi:hypothetical protein
MKATVTMTMKAYEALKNGLAPLQRENKRLKRELDEAVSAMEHDQAALVTLRDELATTMGLLDLEEKRCQKLADECRGLADEAAAKIARDEELQAAQDDRREAIHRWQAAALTLENERRNATTVRAETEKLEAHSARWTLEYQKLAKAVEAKGLDPQALIDEAEAKASEKG